MLSIVFNYSGSLCHFSWSCILFMYSTPVIGHYCVEMWGFTLKTTTSSLLKKEQ